MKDSLVVGITTMAAIVLIVSALAINPDSALNLICAMLSEAWILFFVIANKEAL